MQYSNCGLTSDLYNLIIVSLSRVTIVLLIMPKVEFAFFDASAHCLAGFALLCTITPKSLSSSLTFNTIPPISYENSLFLLMNVCVYTYVCVSIWFCVGLVLLTVSECVHF